MSKTFNDLAITIKRTDWKEQDRLFVFYTQEHGRVDAIARGVKKIHSKMAGHLEPFGTVQVMIAHGRKLNQVAGASKQEDFIEIKKNLTKIYLANYAFEVLEALTKPEHPDEQFFYLLSDFLKLINNFIVNQKNKFYLLFFTDIFIFKFLSYLGFAFDLQKCLKCKNKLKPKNNYFNPRQGGIICPNCLHNQELKLISSEVIKILRLAQRENFNFFLKLKIDHWVVRDFNQIINLFLEEHLEKPLKTGKIFDGKTRSFSGAQVY
jgi:DNA repair protein RecO (recombination protein O)